MNQSEMENFGMTGGERNAHTEKTNITIIIYSVILVRDVKYIT